MNKPHKNKSSFNLLLKFGCAMMIIAALFFLNLVYVAFTVPQIHLFVVLFKLIPVVLFFILGVIMIVGGLIIKAVKK